MINRPAFFESFASSIRHVDTPDGSLLTYKFRFTAKPGWLRWVLEPVMLAAPVSGSSIWTCCGW